LARYREAIARCNQIFTADVRQFIALGRIGLAIKTDSSLRSTPRGRIRATSAVKALGLPITIVHLHWIARVDPPEMRNQFIELVCSRSASYAKTWRMYKSYQEWLLAAKMVAKTESVPNAQPGAEEHPQDAGAGDGAGDEAGPVAAQGMAIED
jgi:hypothetical protein